MDAKEVKKALKNAREAIRNKDFKEALRHCKTVLASDQENYNALVFIGVAAEGLGQADQAVKAYKKAGDVAPDQLLAWQGLCGFYEKNPSAENDVDLVQVYKKLTTLHESDRETKLEIVRKLAQLYSRLGQVNEAESSYQCLLREDEGESRQRQQTLMEMFDLLQSQKTLSSQHQQLMLKTCQEILSLQDLPTEDSQRLLHTYLKMLLKQAPRDTIATECRTLHDRFTDNPSILETWVLLLMEDLLECENADGASSLREVSQKLTERFPTNPYSLLSRGVVLLLEQKLMEARDLLQKGCIDVPMVMCSYVFLSKCLHGLHRNSECIEICDKGLSYLERKDRLLTLPSKTIANPLQLKKAASLHRIGSPSFLKQAIDILSKLPSGYHGSKQLLVNIHLKQGRLADAEEVIKTISEENGQREALIGRLLFHEEKYLEAMKTFTALSASYTDVSSHVYMLGRSLWQLRENPDVENAQERCFKTFLKAAKLDPYDSDIFLYLGHFYALVQNDSLKAKRCYQKSFDLDPGNEEAGAALCDILVAIGEEEEAKQLLDIATSQANAGSGKWAWLRLGLHQVKHDDPTTAIASFQSALRADPRDNHVWECLAEAYLHRGSYTAALKTFTKAAELDPESVYSLFQIAAIKQTLGEYPDAVKEYNIILEKSDNYVPALKGLGETLLLLAREHLSVCLDGMAQDRCQDALVYLTRAASQRPDLSCLWKLLGDACTILYPLASETFRLKVPSKLVQQTKSSPDSVYLSKMESLQTGARCYGRALKSIPESSSLWHDLGVNYFHQSELSDSSAAELSQKAMQTLKKAINLDPNNHSHWNALGVIACARSCYTPELGQHCFIKSIEAESNNVAAWTNLGSLYLYNDNVQLAHEAFKVAQSLDPKYVACWIGQALIAEIVGHDDAMDLFRHTTELGNHVEGAVGYASWVCSVLQDRGKRNTDLFQYSIKQMAAIPAASDALARYTERVKTDVTAYNMYGLLLEHQELYTKSFKSFKCALDILEKDASKDDQLLNVRINTARVLCKGGNYADSVAEYEKIGSLEKCEDLCFSGLAYYKLGNYKDSYQAYTKALEVVELDEDKAHIHSALGMVAHKFGDIEGAKTALFNGSQQSKPSAEGLKALCSLGLLQSDANLATAAIQELLKLGDGDPSLADVTWLSAAIYILQGNLRLAKRSIQQVIRKYPSCSRLWTVLSAILTAHFPDLGDAASHCARAASDLCCHGDKNVPVLLTLGHLQGGLHSRKHAENNALSSAQKALHLRPDSIASKCSLIAAIHAEAMLSATPRDSQLLGLEQHYLQGVLESGHSLQAGVTLWCWKQRVVGLILTNRLDEAKEAMEQLSSLPANADNISQFTEVLQGVMSSDVQTVQDRVIKEGTQLYLWQVLTDMYIQQGLVAEADAVIRKTLHMAHSESRRQVQLETLLKLASLAYQQIICGNGDPDLMRSVFDEAAEEVMKIDPGCSAVLLMLGALEVKHVKPSRRYYQRALDDAMLRSNMGHDVALARQSLIRNIFKSKKDLPIAAELSKAAMSDGDEDTVKLFQELTEKHQISSEKKAVAPFDDTP